MPAGLLLFLGIAFTSCTKLPTTTTPIAVKPGVSAELAAYRKAVICRPAYSLALHVPPRKEEPITASGSISFYLKENKQPLQLDFKEKTESLQELRVNGRPADIIHQEEHLLIPTRYLKKGANRIDIRFIAGNLSLNRNADYLYTLLVPDRARTVFPVFDQPDLKAAFQLTLTVPKDWKALANGPLLDTTLTEQTKTYRFGPSDTISTYLFSFAAGRFAHEYRRVAGTPMHFYHRETDPAKLRHSLEPIFNLHGDALAFLQDYTRIPYPFQKFDFVAIPDFQYGGMEHVGAIQYKAASLFLDEGATKDQQLARANLIAHETAHMWFGDLVTMTWFDDVWMKEVFANFIADKITQVSLRASNERLKFLVDHFPAAYGVDRTAGANPIRQPLDNLQEAGSLYGAIIYHKAPVMMRQLERLMGPEQLQAGLREYLRTYAFANATWPDLIALLDARTATDLQAWNQVWVNEAGRPLFTYDLQIREGKIQELVLRQQAEDGSDRLWPQLFEVALVYPDRVKELTVNMKQARLALAEAVGEAEPDFILFNSTGQGYGVFPVDERMFSGLYALQDPVARASTYINLYENMLNSREVKPRQLLTLYRQGLAAEKEELNLKLLTGQLGDIYWKFIRPQERNQLAPALEKEIWAALQQQQAPNVKKLLFKAYQNIALSKEAQDKLYQVWKSEQAPAGVTLTEDDYTALALALAVRDYADDKTVLAQQLRRIPNPDRRQRLQFLQPALSADVQVRDAFFASLRKEENREKESWVQDALTYLHHPLRHHTSEKYLPESLALLAEIQRTGDIFFPHNWLQASLGTYQSPEAARVVRAFLQEHPNYNPKLKGKILQAADNLFRAEKLLSDPQ